MSAKKESRIANAARARSTGNASGGTSEFSAVDGNTVHRFIDGALRNSALVSFSSTRDGSAVVLTILHDELPDGKYKEYCDGEKLAEEIAHWAGVFGE